MGSAVQTRQWLLLGAALLLLGGVIGGNLYADRENIEAQERGRLTQQAKVIGENLGRQLLATNLALESIRKDLPFLKAQKDGKSLIVRRLQAMSDAMPGVRTLIILDAEGRAVASNRKQVIGLDLGAREYFQVPYRGRNPATLYVSPPFKTIPGFLAMNVGKVILDERGEFAGVITATLDPEYFYTLLDSVRYALDMWTALAHADGKLLMFRPERPGVEDLNIDQPGSFFARHRASGDKSAVLTGVVYATGEERMMAMYTIKPVAVPMDKPVLTGVSRDLSSIFALWRRDFYAQSVLFAALFLATTLGLFYYQRRQKIQDLLAARYEAERKQAADLLRHSEERFRSIVQNAQAVIFVRDADRKAIYVSPQCERVLGYPAQAYSGQSTPNRIHPEDRERFEEAQRKLYRTGEGFRDLEHRTKLPDGSYRWVSGSASTITLADGTRGAQVSIHDISDKKRSELLQRTRLRLWELGQAGDKDALLQAALDAAEELTGSQIGFFHFVDADQENLTLQAWSTNTLAHRCTAEGKGLHYAISEAGVWVDCFHAREPVIHNDYASLAHRKGMPEGHAQVTRELVVPIIRDAKVTEILGVGNKATDYVQADVEVLKTVAGMVQDILEQRRAGAERAQLAAIVESSQDAIIGRDMNFRVLTWNVAAERMFGYAAHEVIGKDIEFIVPEETKAMVDYHRALAAEGRSVPSHDSVLRARDGRRIDASVTQSSIKDAGGKVVGVSLTIRDIAERKRAEAARAQLATIVESSLEAIISRDMNFRVLSWNAAAERLFGYSAQEVIGKTITFLVPQDRQFEVARNRALFAEGRAVSAYDTVRLTRDGRRIDVSISQSPIRDADGKMIGGSLTVRDITERKRLEEMHRQAQKLESLGTLAGGIAHDFNNILAAIRGNADLAAGDVGPDHAAAESLEEIKKASTRAHELVRRIMAFGRPKHAQQTVVDLGRVVDEVLRLLRSTLPAGIALDKDFAPNTPAVLADAGQIHEAVVNLTTNAAQAIGERAGTIRYRLESVQGGEDLAQGIAGLKPGGYARLTVSDDGCGMDAQTMERIFDAFYTTKGVGGGTGLGLSMVHGIMQGHGGAVTVESSPGKGSSFHLYFPAAEAKVAKEEPSAPERGLLSAGQRVLYVDDEEALISLAKRALSRLGHQISGFTDPREALSALRAQPQAYDVVVTDLSMPHMSGFEVTREVLAVRPGMPVLMTTGNIRPEDEGKAREAGVRELLLKPLTVEELGRALERLRQSGEPNGKPRV